jgi:REP element-mobilizing transposase RayT
MINRGDQREDIFQDEADRQRFLDTLGEACQKTEWQVHAYCLMRNHFHLVIETPRPNLVAGMKWLLGVYTKRFNIRHKLCGHVFAGRYKALVVDGSGSGYFQTVCDYVHLNPVRARLIRADTPVESFRWSSLREYLQPAKVRPCWLRVERLLGEKRIPKDSAAGRREFRRQMEERRQAEGGADYRLLRRGWCLGSEEFRAELLAAGRERTGPGYSGGVRGEAEEAKARRIVREELGRLGRTVVELQSLRKSDPAKVRVAGRLRVETTMSLKWIAEELHMGSWSYVFSLVKQPTKCK